MTVRVPRGSAVVLTILCMKENGLPEDLSLATSCKLVAKESHLDTVALFSVEGTIDASKGEISFTLPDSTSDIQGLYVADAAVLIGTNWHYTETFYLDLFIPVSEQS